MKRSPSLSAKIWISLSLLVAGYFATMAVGFFQGQKTETQLLNVSESIFPAAGLSQFALKNFETQISLYKNAIMIGDNGDIQNAEKKAAEVIGQLSVIGKLDGLSDFQKKKIKLISEEIENFTKAATPVYTEMSSGMENEENYEKAFRLAETTQQILKRLSLLTDTFSKDLRNELSEVRSVTRYQRFLHLVLFVAIVLISMTAIWLVMTRSVSKPLNRVIRGLDISARQVSSVSDNIANTSQSIVRGASDQAMANEETSVSLQEMASMTRTNAENATRADHLMKQTEAIVETAGSSMEELTRSMEEITQSSEETYKIIKVIEDIAFQTNLLSLNASVEATHAGQAGDGFAVVAVEVRNLAMKVRDAANDSTEMLDGTVRKIMHGSGVVSETSKAFSEVVKNSLKVAELLSEISIASNEQAQRILELTQKSSETDNITRENVSYSEEMISVSKQMNAQALKLKNYINDLLVLVKGRQKERRKSVK